MMLDEIKKIATQFNTKVQDIEVLDQEKNKLDALIWNHGNYPLLVVDNKSHVSVIFNIEFRPEDSEKLAELPEQKYRGLITLMKMELSSGRTAFKINADGKKIHKIAISQRIIIDNDSHFTQRFIDGTQEVVVVATRILQLMGGVFESIRAQADTPASTSSDEGMFV